jgi:hypothetical protein
MKPYGTDEGVFELRVFDPKQAFDKSIEVKSFSTLDDRPDLILFSGIFKKKQNLFQVLKQAA